MFCAEPNHGQGTQTNKLSNYTIVLDAGHGGKDPGCLGPHSHEKEICLNVALALGRKIQQRFPNVKVLYTRDKDVFIPLKERASIANAQNADLFISLHCNYVGKKPHVHGAETYVMGLHKTSQNLDVAKRENAVIELEDNKDQYLDFDPDSPLAHIILQNQQTSNLAHSIRVANLIQTELSSQLGREDRGVKQAGFIVLYYTTMPAVLVEMGFLSHKEEEAFLNSPDGTEKMSTALADAFGKYYQDIQPKIQYPGQVAQVHDRTPTDEKRYKIQIAASKQKPLSNTTSDIWKNVGQYEVLEEGGLFKYLTGNFRSLSQAIEEKQRLRTLGFNGAFIVAYINEMRTTIDSE